MCVIFKFVNSVMFVSFLMLMEKLAIDLRTRLIKLTLIKDIDFNYTLKPVASGDFCIKGFCQIKAEHFISN